MLIHPLAERLRGLGMAAMADALVLVRLDRLSEACEAATRMRESIPGYRVGPEINVISNWEYVAELRHALVISGIPE